MPGRSNAGPAESQAMGLLRGKTAIVYGGAGAVGSAVAKAFAREGAEVFLGGRTLSTLRTIADEITKEGGLAEATEVDALSQQGVEEHLSRVVARTGKLDVSFNLISTSVGMGRALTELSEPQFTSYSYDLVRSHFITATAAARQMEKQRKGVILALTTSNAVLPNPNVGGFGVACTAIEGFLRQLAIEAGPKGVRVLSLRTGGTPDNPTLSYVFETLAKRRGTTKEEVERGEAQRTALKRLPLLREVANIAVLLASDYASAMTASTVDATCGDMIA